MTSQKEDCRYVARLLRRQNRPKPNPTKQQQRLSIIRVMRFEFILPVDTFTSDDDTYHRIMKPNEFMNKSGINKKASVGDDSTADDV